MVLQGRKRRALCEGSRDTCIVKAECTHIAALTKGLGFSEMYNILELPVHIICDILSRLPLKDIFRCMHVCKMLLELIKDPYFAKVHLAMAPVISTSLIIQQKGFGWGSLYFYTPNLDRATLSSCSSGTQKALSYLCPLGALGKFNAGFSFRSDLGIVGSCNGLLCLYCASLAKPFYGVCNPILRQYIKLPCPKPSASAYTYSNHSGFGFCPRTKQYKIIRFMSLPPLNAVNSVQPRKMVVDVLTLGSDSWRRIEDAPCPRFESFDPFVNGCLHWVTDSFRPSELISSFDLETEQFRFLAPPPHFSMQYVNHISWISVGVLRECLCLCYVYEDACFDAWVMTRYGDSDSWSKEFSIEMNFFCQLKVEDLSRPVKFLSNGDLWFVSSSNHLVSFSPKKQTFKELMSIGLGDTDVNAQVLSFTSLRDAMGTKGCRVRSFRHDRRVFIFGVRH